MPLRKSWNLPFLSRSTSSSKSMDRLYCLYEVQASVAVVGIDRRIWIAYGAFDTYFDKEESADDYYRMNESSWTAPMGRSDPLMAGQMRPNSSIWTHREYFLRVFEIRILRVREEWSFIIDKMANEVEQYVYR